MRCIDADALKELFPDNGEGLWTYNITAKAYIDAQPTIEPERKTGHWIDGKLEWHGIVERYCSECGQRLTSEKTVRMKFCPNCGAKMEEGEQDG